MELDHNFDIATIIQMEHIQYIGVGKAMKGPIVAIARVCVR